MNFTLGRLILQRDFAIAACVNCGKLRSGTEDAAVGICESRTKYKNWGNDESLELDGLGKVRLRYRKGRIEFMNGDRCIGHLKIDGLDHEL